MKLNQVLQSIFLALILVGLFAMMAQNGYGYTLMGTVCFGLALLYFAQAGWNLFDVFSSMEKKVILGIAELFLLALLLTLFGFRAFYIYLPGGEDIFIMVGCFLFGVYLINGHEIFTRTKRESPALAWTMASFYSSVLLFIVSMLTLVMPFWSRMFGVMGMAASLFFIFSVVRQRQYDYSGKTISAFQFVVATKNKAGLLFLFFLSSALYTGLAAINIIPAIENASKPRTYIELINNAETGKEKLVDGQYQHEKYKEAMDKFLDRHGKR